MRGTILCLVMLALGACADALDQPFDAEFTAGDNPRCDAILAEAVSLLEAEYELRDQYQEKLRAYQELENSVIDLSDELMVQVTRDALQTLGSQMQTIDVQYRQNIARRQALGKELGDLGCSTGGGGGGGFGPTAGLV